MNEVNRVRAKTVSLYKRCSKLQHEWKKEVAQLLADSCFCSCHFIFPKTQPRFAIAIASQTAHDFYKIEVDLRPTDNNILSTIRSDKTTALLFLPVTAQLQYVWSSFRPFLLSKLLNGKGDKRPNTEVIVGHTIHFQSETLCFRSLVQMVQMGLWGPKSFLKTRAMCNFKWQGR